MGEINIIKFYIKYLQNVECILNGDTHLLNNNDSTYFNMIKNII